MNCGILHSDVAPSQSKYGSRILFLEPGKTLPHHFDSAHFGLVVERFRYVRDRRSSSIWAIEGRPFPTVKFAGLFHSWRQPS